MSAALNLATHYDEWLTLFATRDEFVFEYADVLCIKGGEWDGWPDLNAAVQRRWSPSGLAYIKRKAWKLVRFDREFVPNYDVEGS